MGPEHQRLSFVTERPESRYGIWFLVAGIWPIWVSEARKYERTDDQANEWTDECINEWTDEWNNERTNEWTLGTLGVILVTENRVFIS